MPTFKDLSLILCCLAFICVCGSGLYEHVAVVPQWAAAPPLSLAMFQKPYSVNPAPLWQSIHPVTLLLLILAIASNWKTGRRKKLLIAASGYLVVLIITTVYFVPQLLQIIHTPFQPTVDPALQAKASLWETLSIVRLVFMLLLAGVLLSALLKSNTIIAVKQTARRSAELV